MIKVTVKKVDRIRQGDILKDIEYIDNTFDYTGIPKISSIINFSYVIVLTQDCDLEQENNNKLESDNRKNQDKFLLSIILAPLYKFEQFLKGEHLSVLNRKMSDFNTKEKTAINTIKNNTNPRYHYIEFPNNIEITNSVIDFKHYFSINSEYLNTIFQDKFICSIDVLYREQISQRFSNFLSRIGLPDETETKE